MGIFEILIYAQLGRPAAMEPFKARLVADDPEFSAEGFMANEGDFLLPQAAAERALFLESFVKAGLRICDTAETSAKYPDERRLPECEAERAKAEAARN